MNIVARLQGGPDLAQRLMQVPSIARSSLGLAVGDRVLAEKLQAIFPSLRVEDTSVNKCVRDDRGVWERDHWIQNPWTHQVQRALSLEENVCVSEGRFESQLYPSIEFIDVIGQANIPTPPMEKPGAYLEGGNVFYCLLNREGSLEERLAVIIGVTTILWTRTHLGKMGYFTNSLINEEIRRMQEEKVVDYGQPSQMAKWRVATQMIAEALGVKVANVICLEHNLQFGSATACLHIDLNIALGPENKVFVHSPTLAEQQVMRLDRKGLGCAEGKLLQVDQEITERNCETLKKYGFNVIRIAGYYGSLTDNPIQETYFLNGLFFQHQGKHVFVTAAAQHASKDKGVFTPPVPQLHALSEAFSDAMAEHRISVVYINLITHLEGWGGVHCLTNEKRVYTLCPFSVLPVENMIDKIPTLVVFRLSERVQNTFKSLSLFFNGKDVYTVEPNMLKKDRSLPLHVHVPLEGATLAFQTDTRLTGSFRLLPGHPREIIVSEDL